MRDLLSTCANALHPDLHPRFADRRDGGKRRRGSARVALRPVALIYQEISTWEGIE
jgi:hypothetical protein